MTTEAASLTLLKGAKQKAAMADELDKSAPAPAEDAASNVYEVDTMSAADIDKMVTAENIETPATWGKMPIAQKRQWLNTMFATPAGATAEAVFTGQAGTNVVPAEPAATITEVLPPKAKKCPSSDNLRLLAA